MANDNREDRTSANKNTRSSGDKRVSLTSRVSSQPQKAASSGSGTRSSATKTTSSTKKSGRSATAGSRSVSLSQRAGVTPAASQKKKKARKTPVGKIILYSLVALLLIACFVLGIVVYPLIKDAFSSQSSNTDVDVDTITYTTTPSANSDKVAYYLVGLLGEDDQSEMQSLAMLCYDKGAGSVNILQVPVSTYLGDKDHWKVNKVGNVWNNPMEITWCPTCRKQVYEPEIAEDNTHSVCGTALTQKEGSPAANLIEVFNYQYSTPIDNYLLFPQEALVKVVDLLGGLDVSLSSAMTLNDIQYASGIQTLDGQSVLEYLLYDGDSVSGDVEHQVATRAVWVALFQRMAALDASTLYEDVLYPVMYGSTPMKTVRDDYVETDTEQMCQLIVEMGKLSADQFTFYLLPGETAKSSGVTYYSAHKTEVTELLSAAFNPYGDPLSEENLMLVELTNTKTGDTQAQTFAQLAVEQTGFLSDDEEDNSSADSGSSDDE